MARAPRPPRLPRGPLFRPLDVKSVKDDPLDVTIEASPEECAAVAAETDLPGVKSLHAEFSVARRAGGRFEVSGDLKAEITQICVVTLDPFDSLIEQPVDLTFAPTTPTIVIGNREDRRGRHVVEPVDRPLTVPGSEDQEDPPDPIVDDTIDLGAVAVEFLTLARDPYPRKPEVHFSDMVVGEDEPKASAFAALERLKDRS